MGKEHIAHSGTEGMRWYNRRYQYPDGTYTELGKERRRVGNGERRPLLTEKEKLERRESYYDKKEAIRKGDIIYANKHFSEFSNQELDDIFDRYYKNQKISDIMSKIEGTDKTTAEKIAEKLRPISNIADSSAIIFKSINTIHKSMYEIGKRGKKGEKDESDDKKKDNRNNKKKKGFFQVMRNEKRRA